MNNEWVVALSKHNGCRGGRRVNEVGRCLDEEEEGVGVAQGGKGGACGKAR